MFKGFEKPDTTTGVRVPESFFGTVIAKEKASVIKIVSFFLTRTIKGEAEIEASYSEIMEETHLSRCGVHHGIIGATRGGYLRVVRSGDSTTTNAYALLWQEADQTETPAPDNHQSENHSSPLVEIQTAKADSIIVESKLEEIESSPPTVRKKARPAKRNASRLAALAEQAGKIAAPYLATLCRDFSFELGDSRHLNSNQSQVLNLWRESGLSEKAFAEVMYEARALTRRYAVFRPGELAPPPGTKRNQMAYFFVVLRDLLGRATKETVPNYQYARADTVKPTANLSYSKPASPNYGAATRATRATPQSWKAYTDRPTI